MSEIERYRDRLEAVGRDVAALPTGGWGEPGAPDPETGERWDRGNVLGHVAEMLPYWTGQVRAVLEGGSAMGRDEAGTARRRAGIDSGREAGEEGLLRRIEAGLAGLRDLLDGMQDADLERRLSFRGTHSGTREVDLRFVLDNLLVGHLEAHVAQLRELG